VCNISQPLQREINDFGFEVLLQDGRALSYGLGPTGRSLVLLSRREEPPDHERGTPPDRVEAIGEGNIYIRVKPGSSRCVWLRSIGARSLIPFGLGTAWRLKHNDDPTLAHLLERLVDQGFVFTSVPHEWAPCEVLLDLRKRGFSAGRPFQTLSWTGPNAFKIDVAGSAAPR
jgi:hypothetical protein